MNSSSSGTNAKPWYQPTTLDQDQLNPTGYKLPTGLQPYYLPSIRTNFVAQLHTASSLEASRPPPGPKSCSTPLRTPRSIVELTEVAEQSLDDVLPSITWVRMAENARRQAESFYEQGEYESAFIEFTRAVTILRDKLPIPDDRSPLTSTGRYHISTYKQDMLDRLIEIKVHLMKRYEQFRSAPESVSHLRSPHEIAGLAKRRANVRDAMLIPPRYPSPLWKKGRHERHKQVVAPVSPVSSIESSPSPVSSLESSPSSGPLDVSNVPFTEEVLEVTAEVLNEDGLSSLGTDSFISDTSIASYKTEKSINSRKSRYNALPRRKYADIGQPSLPPGLVSEDVDEVSVPKSEDDTNPEPSSATRRRNMLARALFGTSDSEDFIKPPSLRPTDGLSAEQSPQFESSLSSHSPRKTSPSSPETLSPTSPDGVSSSSATEQRDKQRKALVMEVQRRADAATVQLKRTPSSTKANDGSHKKRIEKSQISGPKLVVLTNFVEESGPKRGVSAQPLERRLETFESSVYGLSIANTALRLGRTINRWASEVLRIAPAPAMALQKAILTDIAYVGDSTALFTDVRPMTVQYLLRNALVQVISEGIINSLIVTNSFEANLEFTRAHERLLDRDVAAAAVWRRHTLSVAFEDLTPEMMQRIFEQNMPLLAALLSDSAKDPLGTRGVLEDAFKFSCMLRGANADVDALYRSFVPELASTLDPDMVELVNPCRRSERGEVDRVGVTIFPGLVEVLPTPPIAQTVVRRAQVICECELLATTSRDPV